MPFFGRAFPLTSARAAWVVAAAVAAAAAVHAAVPLSPYDDAFIIFRYVENVLEGRGPVYNSGERVLGLSCPLYAAWLLLAKIAAPGVALPALAVRLNAIFLVAAAAAAWLLVRRSGLGQGAAAAAGAAVALSEGILRSSIGGMESSLFTALALGALAATVEGRDTAALLIASLAALTRPEGV
ncbi:MAG TPA: hypothetical protein VJV23_13380, partial [Candidatus Polarisedimenticolia bacterium]|nr:hypothetical protein [Candidatus Polarisedimenticolia bacterium]